MISSLYKIIRNDNSNNSLEEISKLMNNEMNSLREIIREKDKNYNYFFNNLKKMKNDLKYINKIK
jgi:hypothetical protein